MITALFWIGGILGTIAVGLAWTTKAPVGFEDDNGFHFGHPNSLGSDAARTLFITDFSQQPEGKIVTPRNLIRIQWMRPALGLAALFVMLLVLLPENHEKMRPMTFSQNLFLKRAESSITETLVTTTVRGESSRLVQDLCQRFNRME